VLGPLMHEFGWGDGDHDLLAAGSLVGHVLECGPQCNGGIHTDWDTVPGWDDMGYPIAECRPDGTATIEKPPGTGGRITPATVGEQILYEIGDPGAYVMADVVCDWRQVRAEQVGPDRVRVSGARGSAPTPHYKATATVPDGHRSLATALFAGIDAAGRARRAGRAMVTRVERLLAADGHPPLTESSVEVIGAGDTFGDEHRPDTALEAVLKVGVRHPDRDALGIFASEFAPMSLVAQGMTGIFAGRPRVAPVFRVHHLLVDKSSVAVQIATGASERPVAVAAGEPGAVVSTAPTAEPAGDPPLPAGRTVPLRRVAWGRSGDKGDKANIGLIARHPDLVAILRDQVPVGRVARFFAHYLEGEVERWELPGLNAFNYVLDGVLGGTGGTSSLRYDPQAKSYAAMLLTLPVTVPRELEWLLHAGPAA
ncbi:MAG: hypothetical protein JWN32_3241, partial [Solirubrobacterales bacterium]|nr:hypothetical protein [Solirubrobacterales bacterium]